MNILFYIIIIFSFMQGISYAGKDVEYSKEYNQLIVRNTKGQAIQTIKVPAFDLLSSKIFSPKNKRVIEIIETKGHCEFTYFDKLYTFTYPITTEITLAHPEDPENQFVFTGLRDSNRVFIDDIEERFENGYSIAPDQTPLDIVGCVEQHNLSLFIQSPNFLAIYPQEYKGLISEMIHRLRGEIFQVWTVIKQGSEDYSALRDLGFHRVSVFPNLDDGGNEALYSLIMDESQLEKEAEPVVITAPPRIDEIDEEEPSNESVIEEEGDKEEYCYSFLVRNEEGRILAGIYGALDFEAVTPYSLIIKIWVSPEHRGMGIGGRLLDLAENYTLDAGIRVMELGTSSFQAPWLYESRGYKCYVRRPNFKNLRDGSFADRMEYRKCLGQTQVE